MVWLLRERWLMDGVAEWLVEGVVEWRVEVEWVVEVSSSSSNCNCLST